MYELGLVASSWLLILCILSNALWPFRFLYLWSIFRTLYHYSIGFCISLALYILDPVGFPTRFEAFLMWCAFFVFFYGLHLNSYPCSCPILKAEFVCVFRVLIFETQSLLHHFSISVMTFCQELRKNNNCSIKEYW